MIALVRAAFCLLLSAFLICFLLPKSPNTDIVQQVLSFFSITGGVEVLSWAFYLVSSPKFLCHITSTRVGIG